MIANRIDDAPCLLDAARCRLKAGESPETVSLALKLGYDSFRKRFPAITGLRLRRLQMLRHIEHACTLLREDALPIKEIA